MGQCISTIHHQGPYDLSPYPTRTLITWCIVTARGQVNKLHSLLKASNVDAVVDSGIETITNQRRLLGVVVNSTSESSEKQTFSLGSWFNPERNYGNFPRNDMAIQLLATELRQAILNRPIGNSVDWVHDSVRLGTVFELLSCMAHSLWPFPTPLKIEQYLDGLRAIFDVSAEQKLWLVERAPGLRLLAFWIACHCSKVVVGADNKLGKCLFLVDIIKLIHLFVCRAVCRSNRTGRMQSSCPSSFWRGRGRTRR